MTPTLSHNLVFFADLVAHGRAQSVPAALGELSVKLEAYGRGGLRLVFSSSVHPCELLAWLDLEDECLLSERKGPRTAEFTTLSQGFANEGFTPALWLKVIEYFTLKKDFGS